MCRQSTSFGTTGADRYVSSFIFRTVFVLGFFVETNSVFVVFSFFYQRRIKTAALLVLSIGGVSKDLLKSSKSTRQCLSDTRIKEALSPMASSLLVAFAVKEEMFPSPCFVLLKTWVSRRFKTCSRRHANIVVLTRSVALDVHHLLLRPLLLLLHHRHCDKWIVANRSRHSVDVEVLKYTRNKTAVLSSVFFHLLFPSFLFFSLLFDIVGGKVKKYAAIGNTSTFYVVLMHRQEMNTRRRATMTPRG